MAGEKSMYIAVAKTGVSNTRSRADARLTYGYASKLRDFPQINNERMSKLQKANLMAATFRFGYFPALLIGLTIVARHTHILGRVPRLVLRARMPLRTKSGVRLKVPLSFIYPSFEVFSMRVYDFVVLPWETFRTVIDCGAHVGSFTLWMTQRSACQVLAVEPNPRTHVLLRDNLRHLGERVSFAQVAVAGTRGARTLHGLGGSGSASFAGSVDAMEAFEVPTLTLHDVLEQSSFADVDLLKMDVEGAEQEIFLSVSLDTLQRIRATIIECHENLGANAAMIMERLAQSGMRVEREEYLGTSIIVGWRE